MQTIHGVLLLDKPQGLTSNGALGKAKRLLGVKKAGHTGTLDPMATGLLPLCFGDATKFSADLLEADKGYLATLKLGVTTDTGDAEGETLATHAVNVTQAQLDQALSQLRGTIAQVPPMYSALKRDGRPLYEYARAGIEVERAARTVHISALTCTDWQHDVLSLAVTCSKGTYIRVLAEDLGKLLGCGAHLTALRRTQVGSLVIAQAHPLAALELMTMAERLRCVMPVDALLSTLPSLHLDSLLAQRFVHGQRLPLPESMTQTVMKQAELMNGVEAAQAVTVRVRVYHEHGLLGTAQLARHSVLSPERLIAQTDSGNTVN